MADRFARCREAGRRAVEFTLQYQRPDGAFIWDKGIRDAYHKQIWSWSLAGELSPAHRLADWIVANTLEADGSVRDYSGDIYKLSWMAQGAHRLQRYDLSRPLTRWLAGQQADCGGFPHFAGDQWLRALPTAWAGLASLAVGRDEVAEAAAKWCLALLDQPDVGRFYYRTSVDGTLATADVDPDALFIDMTSIEQPYWEIGLPWMLCDRLFMATGSHEWLESADAFFELHLRCADDRFTHTGSGKSSLAAALHFVLTGDERARAAALAFCDRLLETQRQDGSWIVGGDDALLIRIDAATEFNVWLQEITGLLGDHEER